MAAASSTNSASMLASSTAQESTVATTIATSQLQPSHIVLSTVLPPASTLRVNNGPVQNASPPETCHHITLADGKGHSGIVPVLVNHQHHLGHNQHHGTSFRDNILADSSTIIETASPMITTTSTIDLDHQQTVMNILDDCTATSSTTSVLMHPISSTSMHSSTIMKTATSSPLISSLSHHSNINVSFGQSMLFDESGSVIGATTVNETLPSGSSPVSFLSQCSSHFNNNNNNIDTSGNRVIVNHSPSVTTMPVTIVNESHVISNVDATSVPSNSIHNMDDSRLQIRPLRENKSCSTDTLNSSASNDNSLSSAKSDLEEGGGYQDNTSSNSQQSGGGGSVSGGGGSGNGSYVSLIQPSSIGQSGIVGGHSGSGNLSAGNMGHGGGGSGGNGIGGIGGGSGNGPHYGSSGQTGGLQTGVGEQTDFKYLFEELCPVCGDKVSGYHYGLLTCESCKGFFKRTVQNKKVYTCVAERRCLIDKTQRKRCPYCRFQKCLDVGMKLEAVRADRMRGGRNKFGPMYKRDRARKLQMMRQRQLALQAIRGSMSTSDVKPGQISPTGYQQSYPSMNIKQEIQIPQVSSLTQSPDSSPSPIAIALGQVNPNTAITATTLSGSSTNTTTVSGTGTGNSGPGSDNGSSSLQHSSDSKICFDSGTNPSSTADSVVELRVSPMIREFVQSVDDREWQTQLFTLLQKQSYNQVEVDLFELMCKVLDQNLFSQVDWARNTIFFKDLKVDDQMKLLQFSWSDMLVLDHLHQRIHNGLPDETPLHNGQIFNLINLGLLGVPQLADYFNELQNKLQELKFDMGDYVCMKFLILLNPNVRGIVNRKTVLEGHENVQAALLDYTLTCYPSVSDKFSRLLNILPEIHAMATRGEEHLYIKHCAGSAPTQTLLMEMLHAKRKV